MSFPDSSTDCPYKADNDFLAKTGVSVDNASVDLDNQALVWRVTLPSVPREQIEKSVGNCKQVGRGSHVDNL